MQPKLINRVYLGGPLEGKTLKEMFAWRDKAKKLFKKYDIQVYIPGEDTTKNDAFTITTLDFMMIDNSEALLVNLEFLVRGEVASGTLIELGYAKAKSKLIVAFSKHSRAAWPKEHRFLRGITDLHFYSLEDAVAYLGGFNKRKRPKK